jgi:hypothetical protein
MLQNICLLLIVLKINFIKYFQEDFFMPYWFCGLNVEESGSEPFWTSTTQFNNLKNYKMGSNYFINLNSSQKNQILHSACVICSYAMILKNLGATVTPKSGWKDPRTKATVSGTLGADPLTIAMVNNNWPTIDTAASPMTSIGSIEISGFSDNKTRFHSGNTNSFNYVKSNLVTLSGTDANKAKTIISHLKTHPEGVVVRFNENTATQVSGHSFVVISYDSTKINDDGTLKSGTTKHEDAFNVYDPGRSAKASGCNVKWSTAYYKDANGKITTGNVVHASTLEYFSKA